MKKINLLTILTLFLSILLLPAFGQKQKKYIEKNKKYTVAKIYKKNFKTIKVNSLMLINDSTISFNNINSNDTEQISMDQVRYFSVKNGTKALPYGLYGAGVGAFAVLIASGKVAGDSNLEFRDNLGLRIALIVGGCGAIGAGIGALTPKWKRLYVRKNKLSTSFILYPAIYKDYYCVGLTVNF